MLDLQGDRDDCVSLQQCQDAVHAMIVGGQAASMRIVPGALHAFDRADVPPTPIPGAITSTTFPTIYMTDTGIYIDPRTGQADPALTAKDFTSYAAKAGFGRKGVTIGSRSEEHTSELQSLMRISYAVFCLKKKTKSRKKRIRV